MDPAGEGRALCESLQAPVPSNLCLTAGEVEDERLPTASSHSSSPRLETNGGRRELGFERVGSLIQTGASVEDGQSLERGEVCTGTGSAIVSGRSKQAGASSVSA